MASIGVEVTTALRSGPSNPGALSGRFHIAGLTEFGPTDRALVVRSIANFEASFGARTAYTSNVYDTARTFFEEGGSELVVSRVVGPGATNGLLTLSDGAVSPLPTLQVEARDPGAYSPRISAGVTADSGTYTLSIYLDGNRVGKYAGLVSPVDAVNAARSNPYVKVTDLGSATEAPLNAPAVTAITPLSLGSDDRAGVTAGMTVAALDNAGDLAQGGSVAVPGYSADLVGALLLDHAYAKRKIAILATLEDATSGEAVESATTLGALEHAEYGGLFWPHLTVRDGTSTRNISPESYVAAVRARASQTVGYWQVPAGDRARTRWVLSTSVPVSEELNNTLAEGNVNGIVTTGTRVRLYNWASLSLDRENMGLLSARDTLNNLTIAVKEALEPYVFSVLDGRGHLLGYIESAVVGVLDPIAKRGGFYAGLVDGEEVDPGYRVVVDTTNNPLETLALNEVRVSVSTRLSPSAALIQVEIIKVPLTAAV